VVEEGGLSTLRVKTLALRLVLEAMVLYVSLTLFTRLLIYTKAGTINPVASIPAFATLGTLLLLGTAGVVTGNGWALGLYTLTGWLAASFYEPSPLLAGIVYSLLLAVPLGSGRARLLHHLAGHVLEGPGETVSAHLNSAVNRFVGHLSASMALSIGSVWLGASLLGQARIPLPSASILAVVLITSLILLFALALEAGRAPSGS